MKKMRLYIGLMILALLLVGGGVWGLLNSQPRIQIPEDSPVIAMELDFVMGGASHKLYLYDDGAVLYIEEKNLRMPTPESPPTRVWSQGQIQAEELNSILRLFQTDEFAELDEEYNWEARQTSDLLLTISVHYQKVGKTVLASGYLSPDEGLTYPDMPYPLNERYKRLRVVIDDNIQEVYQEPIRD